MAVFRYAGYCPQLKYHVGRSYGQLTAKLLSSPEVSHSQRLVLHTGRFPSTENETGPRDEIWRGRHGVNRKLEKMIPGYTGYEYRFKHILQSDIFAKHMITCTISLPGFVPMRQNHFSKTYAETCREALSQFNREQERRIRTASADLPCSVNNSVPDFKVSCHAHFTSL